MGNYKGVIIEESLTSLVMPDGVKILSSEVEKVTTRHKTPWLKKWTLHTVKVDGRSVDKVAEVISESFETEHNSWYADFKNEQFHYVIFPGKIFKIDGQHREEYRKARDYGLSLGIPDYQLAFEKMK